MRQTLSIVCLVTALLADASTASAGRATSLASPIRILPLGDSITHGVCCSTSDPEGIRAGYRLYLRRMLANAGYQTEFVGSLRDGPSDLDDPDHEGHNGWTTTQLREIAPSRLAVYQPTIILLLAGTNNMTTPTPESVSQAVSAMAHLLDTIEQSAPSTLTLVMPIPLMTTEKGSTEPWRSTVTAYNAAIASEVGARIATGHPVRWVPMAWEAGLIGDGIHPNEDGYERMASAWYQAILPMLGTEPASCHPRPRITIASQSEGPSLRVNASAASAIQSVAFGQGTNAQPSNLTVSGSTASFRVSRLAPGAFMQPFTVTDACGPWVTFVGSGS